jgi:predicted transcriptional regulator of viral defense system
VSTDSIIEQRLGEHLGLIRSRDAVVAGTSRTELSRMVQRGELVRVARGVYQAVDARPVDSLAVLGVTHPDLVVCLLSALAMHGLTTQVPRQVWVAISNKAAVPRVTSPALEIVRMSDESLRSGVLEKSVDGALVRVTGPARTVADCFKFRSRVGLDVAIEALRTAWDQRAVTMDDLWSAAQTVRMSNVMRPYLESLT